MRNLTDSSCSTRYYNGTIVKISSPVDIPPAALDVGDNRVPTVLIVDDDPIVRNLVRLALSDDGYAVMDATDAAEAAALCECLGDQQIDLLIIDHRHGPWRSREVAESIMQSCPAMKVLVISGRSFQEVQGQDGFLPGSSFLQKPFTPQQILSTVQSVLFPSTQ
jgi:two-component system KDP operon response regulator KdpE